MIQFLIAPTSGALFYKRRSLGEASYMKLRGGPQRRVWHRHSIPPQFLFFFLGTDRRAAKHSNKVSNDFPLVGRLEPSAPAIMLRKPPDRRQRKQSEVVTREERRRSRGSCC